MHMVSRQNSKTRMIMISVAVLLTVTLSFSILLFNTHEVQAKTSLPGIEKIVTANETEKPFVIVEILPDLKNARLGYLVSGEEPVNDHADSLSTMPSKEERQEKMGKIKSVPDNLIEAVSLSADGYTEAESSSNAMKIYGAFSKVDTNAGDYSHEDSSKLYEPVEIDDALLNGDITLFRKYMTFKTDIGEGNYSLKIKKIGTTLPPVSVEDCYNYQYFVAKPIVDADFSNAINGDIIFISDSLADTMEYSFVFNENTITQERKDEYSSFYIVREAQGTDEGEDLYYISGADNTIAGAPYHSIFSYDTINKDDDGTYASLKDNSGVIYIKKSTTSEYNYVGTGNGDYLFNQDFTGELQNEFQYSNGFLNNDWLEKYVFDVDASTQKDLVIDIVPVTPDKITDDLLNRADLLYFSGGSYKTDIDSGIAETILNMVLDGIPTVLNQSVAETDGNPENLVKLVKDIVEKKTSKSLGSARSYVSNNLLVFDDTTGKELIDNNFNLSFLDAEIIAGFEDILKEIDSENNYLKVAGKEDRIDRIASPATAFRYVINCGNRRVVTKAKLNILDLEPCDSKSYYESDIVKQDIGKEHDTVDRIDTDSIYLSDSSLSKEWIVENLATQFSGKEDNVAVTMMGTREFVGKQEDLNDKYDLIYIGADTSLLNTVISNGEKTDRTVYNNDSLDGLVYTHMGDTVSTRGVISGSRQMSGNDITVDKLRELREYVEAGYAVLLSDEFFKTEGTNLSVNTDKIDSSSNLYTFLKDTVLKKNDDQTYLYFGKNVNKKSNLIGDSAQVTQVREQFVKYMSISKLVLQYDADDLPSEYNQSDGTTKYLSPDDNGIYRLEYEIALKNDAVAGITDSTYDCGLYIDFDNDGKFEPKEELDGIKIIRTDDDSDMEMNSSGKYELSIGSTYDISRDVPEGYTGFLPWKIVFTANDSTFSTEDDIGVKKAVTGFCAVPCSTMRPEVKVLQIYPSNNLGTIDLSNNDMQALYSQINDFKINITTISATDYIQKTGFTSQGYIDYLNDYDLVVMGFNQNYNFTGETSQQCKEAILAIREYVLSGRSILFSHDFNSVILDQNSMLSPWGYYANVYLRDIQGMDRYGTVADGGNIPSDEKYSYNSMYDIAKIDGNSENDKSSFTDITLMNYKDGNLEYGQNARAVTYYERAHFPYFAQSTSDSQFVNSIVTKLNPGQISEYPFKIPDDLKVSHTHAQYYQLNLDTESTDEKDDDVVVWYTISGKDSESGEDSFYQANKGDARNHYYIYNKGNVTYTGVGENIITDMGERMLLVNTMVAAYKTGIHAPSADYKESLWNSSATITSKFVPYDPSINENTGSFLEKKLSVNFYTNNKNLRNNKELHAKYYIDGTADHYDLYVNKKYLREVHPLSFEKVTKTGDEIIKTPQNNEILDNYTMYSMSFTMEELQISNATGTLNNVTSTNFYIRLGCGELKSEQTYSNIPASESLNKLSIVCTQLLELK